MSPIFPARSSSRPLYTPLQRRRRDASGWTIVQGVLAPLQFVIFAISLALVLRFLATGRGETMALDSVVVKTLALYLIMITGAFWEKAVFGQFLFVEAFFWEDLVSMGVLALHTLYLVGYGYARLPATTLTVIALCAYASYLLNAGQYILKFRRARLDTRSPINAEAPA